MLKYIKHFSLSKKPTYYQMLVSQRIGGAEKLAVEIHKYANRIEIGSSELLVPLRGSMNELVKSENLVHKTYQLEQLLQNRRIPSLIANLDLYLKLFKSSHGLLHIHSPYVFGALRPLLCASQLRTVLHLHLDYTKEQLRWAFKLQPDLLIVCANFLKERLEELFCEDQHQKTRIAIAINAVDINRFFPGERFKAKQRLGIDLNRPLLLVVANLAPHKGQETAIRATSELVERGYKPILWLVGEEREAGGIYTKYLNSLVVHLGLSEFVKFQGFREDIPKLLHAVDFLLLPSTHEGLPLVVLEAQASKVIVLAAPTAGIPEVVEHGRTGFLIEANNSKGYADMIVTLLKSNDLQEVVVETAYQQIISSLTLEKYCENILQEYDQLMSIP